MTDRSVDVILPVLNEAEALPDLLRRFPPGFHPIVVDNASTDGSAEIAADLGASVVSAPLRGFGAACWAGLCAATSDWVAFMDADGSLDPADLVRLLDVAIAAPADRPVLVMGTRVRHSAERRMAMPPHARLANRYLAWRLSRYSGSPLSDLGPMRVAPRRALLALDLQDRRFGWPLEMVRKAADAGWAIQEAPTGYRPRIGKSKVTGTWLGTARAVRDMTRVLTDSTHPHKPAVPVTVGLIAKQPIAGRVKTRCVPPLSHDQAAALATLCLDASIEACNRSACDERVLLYEGDLLPDSLDDSSAWKVIPQGTGGLGDRLAKAFDDIGRPTLIVGMDTPHLPVGALNDLAEHLIGPDRVDVVIAPATDGGYWVIGMAKPRPEVFDNVAMSEADTFELQMAQIAKLGLSVFVGPEITDIDDIDSANEVAAVAPWLGLDRIINT